MLFVDRAILGECDLVAWADGIYQKGGKGRAPGRSEFGRTVEVADTDWLLEHGADIVIGTTGVNRVRMRALADQLDALYVDHVGNPWDFTTGETVLRSMVIGGPQGILYHPEFHRVPWTPPKGKRVGVFHTSFATLPCRSLWDALCDPEWVMYGSEVPLEPGEVAQARSACVAAWVCKDQDGYGFAVHEAFASGRPVIGHAAHYTGKLAEKLFVRGVTYVEPEDDVRAVLADPEPMGRAAMARFAQLVDFDAEATAIAEYLGSRL